jgi:misacylated tRNA(Ala) deacylase
MLTLAKYLDDAYTTSFSAKIISVNGNEIILDQTYFYPHSGGQPNDTGTLSSSSCTANVLDVKKQEENIIHILDNHSFTQGDAISAKINWDRRYKLMKAHTLTHIICALLFQQTGALITGNQLYEDKLRIDFNLETYDKDLLENILSQAKIIISQNKEVFFYYLPKEEAFKLPGALKLANVLPPNITQLRIVEIQDIDVQVDGGTHVKNTSEISSCELLKTENKGKNNRRIVVSFS